MSAAKSTSGKQGDLCRRGSKNTTGIYDWPVPRPPPFLNTPTRPATILSGMRSSLLIEILTGTHVGSRKLLGTFGNDDENVNVTDRKLGKRTSMLPRMPNRARLVVHISFRTPFAAICRLVENVSMFYLFSNFYLRILGISSIERVG